MIKRHIFVPVVLCVALCVPSLTSAEVNKPKAEVSGGMGQPAQVPYANPFGDGKSGERPKVAGQTQVPYANPFGDGKSGERPKTAGVHQVPYPDPFVNSPSGERPKSAGQTRVPYPDPFGKTQVKAGRSN